MPATAIETTTVLDRLSTANPFSAAPLPRPRFEPLRQASDLLSPPEPDTDRPERDIAREVLLTALTQSDERWPALVRLVKAEGVSEHTARRARDELRREGLIVSSKDGMKGGWSWRLGGELAHETTKLPTHNGWSSSTLGGQVHGDDPPLISETDQPLFFNA